MSTPVSLNGTTYLIPATADDAWGDQVSSYLIALATGVLTKAGGSFTLTAETDFGATYGLKSAYYKSRATVSTAGVLRLGNAESVGWRNAGNSADKLLKVNSSNVLEFDGNPILTLALGAADTAMVMNSGGTAYQWAKIANANVDSAAAIAYSKLNLSNSVVNADISGSAAIAYSKLNLATSIVNADISASAAIAYSKLNLATSIVNADISASAAIAYSKLALTGSIVDADISASAAIAVSKLAAVTASRALVSDGSGFVSAATTTATQLGYLSAATGTTGTTSTNLVFSTSPTLVTPTLGVASATSINKVAITAPASSATLTLADGKTLTVSNTLTFTGTDSSSVAFGAGGTVAYTANKLSAFASTSSSELAGVISDETGSGKLVFATSPQFSTNADLLAAGEMRFYNSGSTFYTGFKGGAAAANKIWTLPTADGSANQVLKTDGSGALGWSTVATDSTSQYNVKVGDSGGTAQQTNTNLLGDVKASTGSFTFVDGDVTTGTDSIAETSHGLATGDKVYLTNSGGALPTGLSASTTYYVIRTDANNFKLASSLANAKAGTAVDITAASGGGTHTVQYGGFVLTSGVKGTLTNDNATAGYVGEYTDTSVTTATNYPGSSNQWGDAMSLSLTAGDWDLTLIVETRLNGASNSAECLYAITTTSGNSTSGMTTGVNRFAGTQGTATSNQVYTIPCYRVSVSSTTTYYAKLNSFWTAGTPQFLGHFHARRVR